jgi:hypothetical protein
MASVAFPRGGKDGIFLEYNARGCNSIDIEGIQNVCGTDHVSLNLVIFRTIREKPRGLLRASFAVAHNSG